MSKGYRQAPGKGGGKKRTDGKRVAGKQDFGVPGSGGSDPHSKLQDLDYVPESKEDARSNPGALTSMTHMSLEQPLGSPYHWSMQIGR